MMKPGKPFGGFGNWSLNVRAVSLTEGLRAGIAVAVTLLAGELFNHPHFGLAALGALLTCFSDPGGPVRRRAPAVIMFALFSGLAYGVFGLVRTLPIELAAPIAGLAIFCCCYARIYGQGGLQVGNLLCVVIVLALDTPAQSLAQAAGQGLNLAAGAAWAAFLTLILWRLHPYKPSRVALADVAAKLSTLAKDLASLASAEQTSAAFEAHAAQHRRAVRDVIEAARAVALDTFRRRGVVSRRAAQMAIRLQTLEQVFGALIALSDILEHDSAAAAAKPIRLIGGWLAALAPAIIEDDPLDSPRIRASLSRLQAEIGKLENGPLRHVLEALAEHLAVMITAATPVGQPLNPAAPPLRGRLLTPILANFNLGSAPLRHAARAAVVATPVLAITMLIHQPFAHWATITMVLCLQPYVSATWQRSVERIAGTALGGMLAAGIGLLAQTPLALAVTMLPLTIFAFAIRGVSYGAFVAALTPMVVLLVEQIAPGADELTVAALRVFYTLLGGTLAIAANLLLWPGFEHTRLDKTLRAAKAAHAAYVKAVFATLLEGGPPPDSARRAAGLASNNLEASLTRALAEPHRGADAAIERGAVADAALRRMAGRLSVLAVDRPAIGEGTGILWQQWRDWLVNSLNAGKTPRPDLPDGEGSDALTRLARQAELIAD